MLGTAEAVKKYSFAVGDGGRVIGEVGSPLASHEAGKELDRQARKFAAAFDVSYEYAFKAVLDQTENAELKAAYAGIEPTDTEEHLFTAQPGEAGVELDRKVQAYMAKHHTDYANAMHQILADPANASLKEEYAS